MNLWLLAALVCGLSLVVASCHDDDNKLSPEEQKEQQEAQEAQQAETALKYWTVVGQLVSMDNYTVDYEGKTFEPTIGTEGDDDQTRVVYTNDAATAAARFANLIDEDASTITEQTPSYSWSDPAIGTLNYTKVTDGTAWATVDVSISQVPHLTKIIYRSPSQADANGGVAGGGSAYYRFGDVISRTRDDGKLEYWVCVRPAFDPEGKGDTHWISVSPLPEANQWAYTSSRNKDYVMPTALGTSKEHMQNLAELLFAICEPKTWYDNVINHANSGMPLFHDFKFENLKYHNQNFWKNVQTGWSNKKVAETVFGLSSEELEKMVTSQDRGLYLLYKGYSWITKGLFATNSPTLYQAHYFNTPGGKYANMHAKDPYQNVKTEVIESDIVIDVTKCTLEKPYFVEQKFFGDNEPRFIVRFATGKQLSKTGVYANNQLGIPGCDDFYRYYRDIRI